LARFTRYPFSLGLALALGLLLTSRPSYAIEAVRVAGGFEMPLGISAPPGDTGRLFIVEQTGRIKIIKLPGGTVNPAPFLNISAKISLGGEQGLLGLAFDPSYASNGRFYVTYTTPGGSFGTCVSHVAEFFVSANPDVADPGSEASLIVVDHPQEQHQMHWMGFSRRPGDEGNLYISSGDGGMFCDMGPGHIEPGGNGQSTQTLFGKILRIHPEETPGTYTIPLDNPFYGSQIDQQEIWAYGLRNPWRCSWDRKTNTMFIADVGQGAREEINVQKPANPGGGENYGWRVREGFVQSPCSDDPEPPNAVDPIIDYPHSTGICIIGGYYYRGNRVRALRGHYIFADTYGPDSGDFTGRIWTIRYDGRSASDFQDITSKLFPTRVGDYALNNPVGFWEDNSGELYICDFGNGNIYKIQ